MDKLFLEIFRILETTTKVPNNVSPIGGAVQKLFSTSNLSVCLHYSIYKDKYSQYLSITLGTETIFLGILDIVYVTIRLQKERGIYVRGYKQYLERILKETIPSISYETSVQNNYYKILIYSNSKLVDFSDDELYDLLYNRWYKNTNIEFITLGITVDDVFLGLFDITRNILQ